MKTKIIYISGSEVFNIADIRGAFDEVRAALGLGGDTVLFGVPVDTDDVGLGGATSDTAPVAEPVTPTIIDDTITPDMDTVPDDMTPPPAEIPDIVITAVAAPISEPVAETPASDAAVSDVPTEDIPVAAPAPKPRRTRRTRTSRATESTATDTPAESPIDTGDTPDEPVVPILSVLAAQSVIDTTDESPTADTTDDAIAPDIQITSVSVDDIDITDDAPGDIPDEEPVDATETIADMINDDIPVDASEKTLEELLEQMTPLREDHEIPTPTDAADDVTIPNTSAIESAPLDLDDTDATLTQLANEFAENEDKIITTPTPEAHGKIGKLKNILPFKKAKREDPGLMGDLFGWAGIAANDDDFSIPGFFTGAASKK